MKRILALLLTVFMTAALAACGVEEPAPQEEVPVTEQTPVVQAPEAEPVPEEAPEVGAVTYLTVSTEADKAWKELAETYTALTGVSVTVECVPETEYAAALEARLGQANAPTLFDCLDAEDAGTWGEFALDLTGTALSGECVSQDFWLTDDTGALRAIGYGYESFGILVNTMLLDKAGYTMEDLTDFAALETIASEIHARSAKLGFDAFVPVSLDITMSHQYSAYMANMPLFYEFRDRGVTEQPEQITGAYLDAYRRLWDLQVQNSDSDPLTLTAVTNDMVRTAFYRNKAVFWLQGSWEYAGCVDAGMRPANLSVLPIYCGVEGEALAGLCSAASGYWTVHAGTGAANIQATLDFLYWVVTSEDGTELLAAQYGAAPFKLAKTADNVVCIRAAQLLNEGKYTVPWTYRMTPGTEAWRAGVVTALAAYAANPNDETWAGVQTAFVDGWSAQYAAALQTAEQTAQPAG